MKPLDQEVIPNTHQKSFNYLGPSLLSFGELAGRLQTPTRTKVCGTDSQGVFKDVTDFLTQIGWSVTSSHHNVTFTGLSADPDLQALTQTDVHHLQQPHTSKLLLLVEDNVLPCAPSLPVVPEEITYVCSTLVVQAESTHLSCSNTGLVF